MALEKLKNRIPPPVITVLSALIMWLLALLIPAAAAAKTSALLGGFFALVGLLFAGAGLRAFRKHQTTVNPLNLRKTAAFVNSGIYRVSRNPMYVGLLFILFGWALFLGNILSMIWLGPWLIWMSELQIAPEEKAMTQQFGDAYSEYCKTVRRWL